MLYLFSNKKVSFHFHALVIDWIRIQPFTCAGARIGKRKSSLNDGTLSFLLADHRSHHKSFHRSKIVHFENLS